MIRFGVLAIVALIVIVVVLPQYKKLLWPAVLIYAAGVLYITLFSRVATDEGQGINLLPFHFVYWVKRYLDSPLHREAYRPILGILLNMLMFVPFGFLAMNIKETATWKIVLAGFVFSLLIETMQLIFHLGMFETDDLMTNTLGTWIGTVVYRKRTE